MFKRQLSFIVNKKQVKIVEEFSSQLVIDSRSTHNPINASCVLAAFWQQANWLTRKRINFIRR
jgi:hypothetical protein